MLCMPGSRSLIQFHEVSGAEQVPPVFYWCESGFNVDKGSRGGFKTSKDVA